MKIKKDYFKCELVLCLLEQIYHEDLDLYALATIGLFEMNGDLIDKIVEEEFE